jgi:hypothetical protein
MFSFFVGLELLIISIFLDSAMVGGEGQVLQVVAKESSLDILDVLILGTRKDLVSLLLA